MPIPFTLSTLPGNAGFVLGGDDNFVMSNNKNGYIDLNQYPEPCIGNANANVYILGGNPGLNTNDTILLGNSVIKTEFEKMILQSYDPLNVNSTFYWLDNNWENHLQKIISSQGFTGNFSGFKWWKERTKTISVQNLEKKLFHADFYPYHSKNFNLNLMIGLPSNSDIDSFINVAMNNNKLILIMRAEKAWKKRIDELNGYDNVIVLNSAQCSYITENNMSNSKDAWKKFLDAL